MKTNRLACVLAMALMGCGGTEFTSVDRGEKTDADAPSDEAGGDAGDSGTTTESGGGDVSSMDAASDAGDAGAHDSAAADVAVDTAPTCTPFDGGTMTCGGFMYQAPNRFCVLQGANLVDSQTPGPCACAETYNCACLRASQFCFNIVDCQQTGNKITLRCG